MTLNLNTKEETKNLFAYSLLAYIGACIVLNVAAVIGVVGVWMKWIWAVPLLVFVAVVQAILFVVWLVLNVILVVKY